MNIKRAAVVAALAAGLMAKPVFAMSHEVVNTDSFNLNIGGRIQEVAYGQTVHDPYKDNGRLYLFLKQARFRLNGRVDDTKFDMQWVGAAEDVNGSNNGLTLLDASFDVPLFNWESTWFKVGQFKVPYSRESLNEEAYFQFVEHSIDFLGFNPGRDVGAAIHTYPGRFAGTLGVFTGGSRDVPLRFLPERLNVPLLVARFGYNDGLDKDIFTVAQNDLRPQRTTAATYVNAMYLRDTKIGHSTVLNVRTSDKTLLMNSNWNSFVAKAPLNMGELWQTGWDGAIRGPAGSNGAWNAEAEYNYASYRNDYGKMHMSGARVQTGYLYKKTEFALRYAVLYTDNQLMNGNVSLTGGHPIQELAPAVSYYIKGHDNKVVLDFPVLFQVPVFIEKGVGAYVSTEQVDQATVVSAAGGRVERQTVPEARLMYQLAF